MNTFTITSEYLNKLKTILDTKGGVVTQIIGDEEFYVLWSYDSNILSSNETKYAIKNRWYDTFTGSKKQLETMIADKNSHVMLTNLYDNTIKVKLTRTKG